MQTRMTSRSPNKVKIPTADGKEIPRKANRFVRAKDVTASDFTGHFSLYYRISAWHNSFVYNVRASHKQFSKTGYKQQ